MSFSHACRAVCWSVLLAVICGCGDAPQEKTPDSAEFKTRKIADLPELDEQQGLPLLDDGRIEVTPPKGWEIASRRGDKWLARFYRSGSQYPTIIITAEDYEGTVAVTKENLEEFARQISEALREGAGKTVEGVRLVEIGDFLGVTYRKVAIVKRDRTRMDCVFLETVFDGRKYRFELRTPEGTWEDYEPHLHAVAGGVKFLKVGKPEAPEEKTGAQDQTKTEPESPPEKTVEKTE